MKRRRRKNPSTRDVVGVAIGLLVPLVVVVVNRAMSGRDPVTGAGPPCTLPGLDCLGPNISNAIGRALDPAVGAAAAAATGAVTGVMVAVNGWKPGVTRGLLVGSGVATVGLAVVQASRSSASPSSSGPAVPQRTQGP